MATVGNLVTTIIGDLRRVDASLSDIVLVDIQSSIREYETHRFYFNEQKMSITLSATDTYALSLFAAAGSGVSDVIEVDWMNIQVATNRTYILDEVTSQTLDMVSGGTTSLTGYPQMYTVFNQAIRIYPMAASTGLTSSIFGHVKFTEIAAGAFTATNPWTNDASDLIRNATLKRLWGRRYKDYDAAKACQLAELDSLRALQRRTEALSDQRLAGYL